MNRHLHAAAAAALALVVVAACTRAGGGEVAGPSSRASDPGPTPAMTVSFTAAATAQATTAPLTAEQFWAGLFEAEPEVINYPNLAAMFKDSDAVVLGSLVGVTPGPESDAGNGNSNYELTVTVRVDRLLYGTLPDGATSVPIAVFLGAVPTVASNPYAPLIASWVASMPRERGVFFLQNKAAYYSRLDPTAAKSLDPKVYQVSSEQGLIRDVGGTSWVPAQAPGAWPAALGGKPFDAVLADLAAAAAAIR